MDGPLTSLYSVPVLRPLVRGMLRLRGEARLAGLMRPSAVEEVAGELEAFKRAWRLFLADMQVDALLLPATALPADGMDCAHSGIFLAQLLQWPSGVVPVCVVGEEEAAYHSPVSLPPAQRDHISRSVSMAQSQGLPVGVQVMAPGFKDQVCLRVMKSIEEHASFKVTSHLRQL